MAVSESINRFLKQKSVKYAVIPHTKTHTLEEAADAVGAPYAKMLRSVVLTDGDDYYIAVLPVTHVLDFKTLKQDLGEEMQVARFRDFSTRFDCCDRGCIPPLGQPFNLKLLVDSSVAELDEVFFEAGSHNEIIKMTVRAYLSLLEGANFGHYAYPLTQLADMDVTSIRYASPNDIKRRIEEIYELPAIPAIAHRILELNSQEDASPADLADLVQMDPSLSAQTLRYANSSLFGCKGTVETIHDAIVRVLGFDMVINMALGISIGRSFRNPIDGPLGLNAFWRHSVACAAVSQSLCKLIPVDKRPKPGMAYLTGLLHNFGFLLLGHLFQPEFYLLNKLAAANPKTPITELEQRVLGMGCAKEAVEMGHAQLGAWLMEAWEMPEQVVVSVREHHHADYTGDHAIYVKLVMLANLLLKRIDLGDEANSEIPAGLLDELGLDEEKVIEDFEALIETKMEEVNAMATQMAA